jgi:ankyrin repeat protein
MGYQVNNDHYKPSSRKMKSSLKLKLQAHIGKSLSVPSSSNLSERKLRTAVTTNNTDAVRHLLANGVNVNSSDEQSRSALHFAAAKGYSEIVKVLLQNGADPNAKDILGNTALHLAACTNHIEVVTLLLRGGTDVTTIDNSGRTPMQLAQSKLKPLQKNSSKSISEMNTVKAEVSHVVDMMREYLSKTGAMKDNYSDLLNSFSQRLQLHNNHDEIHSDLQNLFEDVLQFLVIY